MITCALCNENPARYIAVEPTAQEAVLTCGICPIKRGWASILIRNVPALLAVRAVVPVPAAPAPTAVTA